MAEPPSTLPKSFAPETVLVVEPEVLARMMIASYLRECGYKVIEAVNGDEAMLVLREPEVDVRVVFSVIELPGPTNGFVLSQWMRTHRPEVQVILASNGAGAAKEAGDLCEDGPLMKKPYDHRLLADRIKRLLAGSGKARST